MGRFAYGMSGIRCGSSRSCLRGIQNVRFSVSFVIPSRLPVLVLGSLATSIFLRVSTASPAMSLPLSAPKCERRENSRKSRIRTIHLALSIHHAPHSYATMDNESSFEYEVPSSPSIDGHDSSSSHTWAPLLYLTRRLGRRPFFRRTPSVQRDDLLQLRRSKPVLASVNDEDASSDGGDNGYDADAGPSSGEDDIASSSELDDINLNKIGEILLSPPPASSEPNCTSTLLHYIGRTCSRADSEQTVLSS